MYVRCKLELSQGGKSLEVMLDRQAGAWFREVATFYGKFSSSEGNIPPERKIWVYSLAKMELRLMDSGGPGVGMGGGGLDYGELAPLTPSAILSNAHLTNRGIAPGGGSGIGAGEVLNGFEISVSFHKGPITWRLLSFQNSGSNVWNAA
jgi:hypothetical protein